MRNDKLYVKPGIKVIELEMESLLTSFSIGGGVSGPVGIRQHYQNDNDKPIDYPVVHSIWIDEYEEKSWCEW